MKFRLKHNLPANNNVNKKKYMGFLQKTILTLIGNSLLFWILHTKFLPQMFIGDGNVESYIGLGILFGLLNYFLKPVLKLLSLPLTFITLGLFRFIINGFLIYVLHFLVDSQILNFITLGFEENYLNYIIIGIIASIANGVLN